MLAQSAGCIAYKLQLQDRMVRTWGKGSREVAGSGRSSLGALLDPPPVLACFMCGYVGMCHCSQHRSEAQNTRLIELLSSITLEMDTSAVISKVRAWGMKLHRVAGWLGQMPSLLARLPSLSELCCLLWHLPMLLLPSLLLTLIDRSCCCLFPVCVWAGH